MKHQPARFLTLVEVEAGAEETIFHALKEDYDHVFLNPEQKEIDLYISDVQEAIVVRTIAGRAPNIHQLFRLPRIARLEKILVDVYANPLLFAGHQGNELKHIFREVFASYEIDQLVLFDYAESLGKRAEIENFVREIEMTPNLQHR